MAYSTGTVAKLVNVNRETIRNWVSEFGEYMSDDATPPKGEYKRFTEDDVRICAYIAKSRDLGILKEEIHKGLKNGERAEPTEEIRTITARKNPEYAALRRQIQTTKELLDQARQETAQRDAVIVHLEKQLTDAHEKIDKLNQQIGGLKNRLGNE